MLDIAQQLLTSGLCVLPARRDQKRPTLSGWKSFQKKLPTPKQIETWFASDVDALCIVTGSVSGNLELIDFDFSAELFGAWSKQIPPELLQRLFIERSQSGGRHIVYRCEQPVCGNLKLAQDRRDGKIVTMIETRGEGGLFLCHPTPGYTIEQGSLTDLPVLTIAERDQLLESAWGLNRIQGNVATCRSECSQRPIPSQPPTGNSVQDRAIAYLAAMPPAIAGAGGHSQTYAAATALVHGFGLAPATALQILSDYYNPRCDPPWSDQELQHKINQAATKPHQRPFGWLCDDRPNETDKDVDLSAFKVTRSKPEDIDNADETDEPTSTEIVNPGHLPERLLRIPGFIERVMDFTMANAPYPNLGLAFCGAMALQSFLAGRQVSTVGDLRTNLYLLALASSGTGKEFPRKVNSQVLYRIGMSHSLGDKFASGEGIQDALLRSGRMLFQNDEMDGVLRQINLDRDNSRESIPNILLTLYTSAGDVYPIRVKANQKEAMYVDQPHLTLFGTATPQHFYESLSKRMLTNGFFARLNIIDVGRRGKGQTPGSVRDLPESVIEIAQYWADAKAKAGNLQEINPGPRVVEFTKDATAAVNELRLSTEIEYEIAENAGDEAARAAWSRTCEHATKLALIYACSVNHRSPVIDLEAMKWASEFALHQTRRQLFLASVHVAENPFHAECLRFKKRLADKPNRTMRRREIMRSMTVKVKDFEQIVQTLTQQEEIEAITIESKTKPAQAYRLLRPFEICR